MDVEGLAKLETKEELTILLGFFMTISKNIKRLSSTMKNFYKFAKVLVIVMAKLWPIIVLELIIN